MNFENFVQKTVRKKGILGLASEDPHVAKINSQILMLEEIFENRRNLDIKRPKCKDVFDKLRNSIATPAFLNDLRNESRKIDKYLEEHGIKVDGEEEDGKPDGDTQPIEKARKPAKTAIPRKRRDESISQIEEHSFGGESSRRHSHSVFMTQQNQQ